MKLSRSPAYRLFISLATFAALIGAPLAQAAAADDAALVNRISTEVVKKLQDSGALDKAIDAGIERFVARQQKARTQAARQRAELAQRKAKNVPPGDPAHDHIYGNPKAAVSLIEYSDFECPFCKRFAPEAKALVDHSGGKLNWVYRHFPLGFHNPVSTHESEASECVAELGGNDAFWKFALALYARTGSNGKGIPGHDLNPLAKQAGVDPAAFDACVKSGRHADVVKKDLAEGVSLGISGTPGNILRNNQTGKVLVRPGALPMPKMQAAVDELLRDQGPAGAEAKAAD